MSKIIPSLEILKNLAFFKTATSNPHYSRALDVVTWCGETNELLPENKDELKNLLDGCQEYLKEIIPSLEAVKSYVDSLKVE